MLYLKTSVSYHGRSQNVNYYCQYHYPIGPLYLGEDGKLTDYAGGLDAKSYLLNLEQRYA